jgi:hypothetical protein
VTNPTFEEKWLLLSASKKRKLMAKGKTNPEKSGLMWWFCGSLRRVCYDF